ncbi:TspO/MBR family protein [Bosea sp. (in: a-proteobacteria)]|uniref:TspO/MBR family protein n=1 Tax=Bosea sp. (in: a-proteobacteria) TaxID=1871050 RepID=UPI002733646F|nr:TspO/MBR family protein [Bosea sp. (in: a-proteobacteria)]MDP3409852.1 TspO/MBR family protein [Bosea sp. (in: a-proteobacteria)]
MTLTDGLGLAGFVVACVVAASSGAIFKPGAWYEGLAKPWWRPPNWLFPPAWTLLYCMIAASGWLVWRKAGFAGAGLALTVYGLQLVLNAMWSGMFFGLRRMDLAFVNVSALWLSILALVVLFAPIDSLAAWLLVPYLVWVSFAACLNFTVWRMNPDASPRNRPA